MDVAVVSYDCKKGLAIIQERRTSNRIFWTVGSEVCGFLTGLLTITMKSGQFHNKNHDLRDLDHIIIKTVKISSPKPTDPDVSLTPGL